MTSPNYITREGAKRLAVELDQLLTRDRPKIVEEVMAAAADGDRSENASYIYGKRRLREIDRRVRFLTKRLDAVRVVGEEERPEGQVFFGALVEVESENGERKRYRLVGEDESNPARGLVSWRSPMGRALIKRKVGDVVVVQRPAGEIELTIVSIAYDEERSQDTTRGE